MNRKQLLNELMWRYSLEEANSIIEIVTEDREFEDENVHIIMTRTFDCDIYYHEWKDKWED